MTNKDCSQHTATTTGDKFHARPPLRHVFVHPLGPRVFGVLFVLLALLLAGCGGGANRSGLSVAQRGTPTPASSPTGTVTSTAEPATYTPVPTLTLTPTPGPSATPSLTPTPSRTPTRTPAPTATPTSVPQHANSVVVVGTPAHLLTATPATPVPTAVPVLPVPDGVTNILLLGADNALDTGISRTDTIIIASVNRETKTASMISLPRDLYVYIPQRGMGSINTAIMRAAPGDVAGAVQVLKDTIVYNFGIPIHYYARVDFAGFETVVDAIGGVDVPISCSFEDHRLISPDLDPEEEDSWELFRVDPGIVHMDGSMALWYVRSRERLEADWGRTKRQQQMLRAIFNEGLDLDLLPQVPALYETYRDTVDTDLDIGRILQLGAVAPAIRENGIQHLYLSSADMEYWTAPDSERKLMLPNWEQMQYKFYALMSPSELNSGTRAPIRVEVINATGNEDMGLLAADNLAWWGFVPVLGDEESDVQETTTLTYYGSNLKGTFSDLFSWVFHQREANIQIVPDEPYDYDYRVVLGSDYDPCINQLFAPRR